MEASIINPQLVTDSAGNKLGVFLPIAEYEKLLEELEDYEDIKSIKAFESKLDKEFIPLRQALNEIEKGLIK